MINRLFARRFTAGWLILPAVLFLAIVFLYPSLRFFALSVASPGTFKRMFASTLYVRVLLNTVEIAGEVALLCVILAYPLAYLLSTLPDRTRNLLLIAVAVPFFTSVLVRSYAWMVLLGQAGIINNLLLRLGLISSPLRLIYNTTGLLISMTHILLPTAVMLLLSVMRGIDTRLLRVSASLGGSHLQSFLRVYLPLTQPGVGAALVLVFIFALGNYVTAALLGGTRDVMLAMVIAQQVGEVLDWPFASALALLLTGATVLLFFLFNRALDLDRMWGGDALRGAATRRTVRAHPLRQRAIQAVLGLVDRLCALLPAARIPSAAPRVMLFLFAGVVLSFLMAPILLIVPISFTASTFLSFPPDGLSLRWYRALAEDGYWGEATLLSVRVGVLSMVIALALGIPAAFALVRQNFPGKGALYAFLISPLIVPSITTAVAIYYVFAPLHLVGTTAGLVLSHTIGGIALVAVIVSAALRGMDRRLESASYSLGAGIARTFKRVTLPLIWPGVLAAAFFAFMHSFDEVVIASFVGGLSAETLPKKMWEGVELELRPTLASLSAILIVFTVVMLLAIELTRRRKHA